jgi:uroporphyrin-III C-methyltransferase/precorrin-2 dehydrogenase/sirohydrochlorin ferrochelatase
VRFVTGHARDGSLPHDLDWRGIADAETTTVFYMGGRTAPEIANRLLAEGLSPGTPAVALASVSRHDERRWHGVLADLAAAPPFRDTSAPVLIGIGRSFAMAEARPVESIRDIRIG